MSEVSTKSIFESKTVWGILIGLFAYFSPRFGVDLDEVTRGLMTQDMTIIAGGVISFYGRLTAKNKIDGVT